MTAVYRMSKRLHRWTGLGLSLFLVWMGISGVLLNHPGLIRRVSLPLSLMPDGYGGVNWNRMAFRQALAPENLPGMVLVGGKAGVWLSRDHGREFVPLDNGFPRAAWDRDTFSLLLSGIEETGDAAGPRLYAGTRSGLYTCILDVDKPDPAWEKVPALDSRKVVSLVADRENVLAFTPSACYSGNGLAFCPVPLPDPEVRSGTRSMAGFLLRLHDGAIIGLPGKLAVDGAGLCMALLALSGGFVWSAARLRKRLKNGKQVFRAVRFCRRWHLRLGIWSAGLLCLITLTGILVRPPFLPWVYRHLGTTVALPLPGGPWENRIFKAAVINGPSGTRHLLLVCRDGFYTAPAGLDETFKKLDLCVRVSGMGATVLEPLPDNQVLVGSFSGLYTVDLWSGAVSPYGGGKGRGRPCTGVLMHGGTLAGVCGYRQGYTAVRPGPFSDLPMPGAVAAQGRMSLWHFLFELHNTRIFKGFLGEAAWLAIPVAGCLTLVLLGTGVVDWWHILSRRRKRHPR